MKTIIFFLFFTGNLIAQNAFTDFMTTKQSDSTAISLKRIENRTWTFSTVDTTAPQNIKKYSSINFALMTTDTVVVVIKYRLSLDGTNWTALTTVDSLRDTTSAVFTKNINMSTLAIGHSYIQFVFSFGKSDVYGTTYASTLRKYWATLKLIQ